MSRLLKMLVVPAVLVGAWLVAAPQTANAQGFGISLYSGSPGYYGSPYGGGGYGGYSPYSAYGGGYGSYYRGGYGSSYGGGFYGGGSPYGSYYRGGGHHHHHHCR